MPKKTDKNLFQKLTQLFRTGPQIKRRVKGIPDNGAMSSMQMFGRSHNNLYNNTMSNYGSFDRMSRYSDFSEMEATPEIAAALDIYSEETTSADEKGVSLHIHSDNRKIKELLDTLFYDTLNTEFNLTMWVRNLCKYGDFFLFTDVSPEYGIINAFPVPISEIEREEGFDPNDPAAVRFRWISGGNRVLENWQVAHFRLLGNDAFLPYGSSILEPARRIWRQLILIEDAMLVYRVIRAPERRVFYIDVGNVPPENVAEYLEQAQTSLKRSAVVDKNTGRVDLRYNPMPVWKNTPIPLLDGRIVTIENLAQEVEAGNERWVYSIQDETQQVVPGKVIWCGKNYTANKMIKVWLDDDTFVMTAPEHPFVMRDGTSKRADELQPGESLMPLYRDTNSKGYERCYNPATQKYETTHSLVAKSCYSDKWKNKDIPVVHHRQPWAGESNKRNNTPENLDYRNHKIIRVEEVFEPDDVYCMTVVGPAGEDDRHNFAALTLQHDMQHSPSGVFLLNSVDEDYFLPVRGGESGTKIDTLSGGQNTAAIEDVEYIQKKLFAALKVPRAYLGYDESIGSKATLAQEDIRFSRTIQRIQKTVIAELNKLAMVHLFSHGYNGEDLLDFELLLSNPSSVAQQQKLELIRARFEIAGTAPEGLVDRRWIRKNVMGLNDDDIRSIEDGKIKDKQSDLEVEAAQAPSAPAAGGGGGGAAGGGGGALGGGEEAGAGEEAGEEGGEVENIFAADYAKGKLLTALPPDKSGQDADDDEPDDEDDDDDFIRRLSIDDEEAPTKAQQQIRNTFNEPVKRSRKVRSGPATTHMPDFLSMTSTGAATRKQDTLNQPFDKDFFNNPFRESFNAPQNVKPAIDDILDAKITQHVKMTREMESTLAKLGSAIGITGKQMILEGQDDLGEGIDLEISLDQDEGDDK